MSVKLDWPAFRNDPSCLDMIKTCLNLELLK